MTAYHFSPYAIPLAIAAVVVISFAIVVAFTRFSRTSVAMLGVCFAAAVWLISRVFLYSANDSDTALPWARIACASVPFLAPAIYQFLTTILESATYRKVISIIAWIFAAQFAVLALTTNYLVTGVKLYWWGYQTNYAFAARVLYPIFAATVLGAALVDILRAYPKSAGPQRSRIRLFAITAAVGAICAVDFLPAFGIRIYPFGWAALLAATVIAFYTIRKYGLAVAPTLPAAEIISSMRDLLLVNDRNGRIRFANQAACAFLGYSQEDIIGIHLEDLLIPTHRDESGPLQGWVKDREYVFRTRMGQPIELTLSHSPITHHGQVTGAVVIGRDLRDRKRYEWEARRAVTLLESTLESTADGILVIGADGRVLTWNQRFADMWGISADALERDEDNNDLIGQLIRQLIDPADFLTNLASLHEHPEVESEHVLLFKDGRRLQQYSIGRYLDDEPVRVWSFRDVTARLAAEEAVRDSETRYRLLFEQNAAGVCLARVSGRIVDCNATFAALVGYVPEELKKRDLSDIFDRSDAVIDDVRKGLGETPTVRGMEIVARRKNGDQMFLLANISLLGQGDNALLHMTAVDITDRKRVQQQVEFQAYHDALTQLPNRRLFVERLEMSLLAAKRARESVAVLFIDLDRFKIVNDTLGHDVADVLLVEIAQRLRSCVRQTDTVARHGGDEFTVILPDLHQPEDAAQVAEKILERVIEPVVIGSHSIEVSVSIGIAVHPFDGTDIETLLRNADDAMYRAKQAGRNNYQLCTEQIKTKATERLSMQSRLRKAMDEGQLHLVYQPVVSIATGDICGAEAVIRWNDSERGAIDAPEFIAMAEETRLIVPLGEWVLFTACKQVRQWSDAGFPPMRVAVNISARQFQQRDLAAVVRRAVDEAHIDPALLELEIRETTVMKDVDLTVELLHPLRSAGVSIAIDDFGSSYSSLGTLRTLPIHSVKMDRALLKNVATDDADASIVAAVISVGRRLRLRVAADGVDTRAQFDFLKTHSCDEGQGAYFGAAVDPDKLTSLKPGEAKVQLRRV